MAFFSCCYSAAHDNPHKLSTVEDVLSEPDGGLVDPGAAAGSLSSETSSELSTAFNGIEVPPMKELSGQNFDNETKDGYW